MAPDYTTYDVEEIAEQWERLRAVQFLRDRELTAQKRELGMMITRRTCTLQDIADKVDVSRAYPQQLSDRYVRGVYDKKLAALGLQVKA